MHAIVDLVQVLANSDGASSGAGNEGASWDFAVTTDGSSFS